MYIVHVSKNKRMDLVVSAAYIQFSSIVYAVNEAKNDVTNLIKQNLVICGLYIKYAL